MERRFRDVTELLYQKQSQLEVMAAQKAAAQLAFEKELMSMSAARQREQVQLVQLVQLVVGAGTVSTVSSRSRYSSSRARQALVKRRKVVGLTSGGIHV
eukprot:3334607-Pyramimonas_sp.AAC.1